MAWGGGTYLVPNKEIPGSFFKFSSDPSTIQVFSDRGVTAIPMLLSWGPEGEVMVIDRSDFFSNSVALFGYAYTHPKLKNLRELFYGAQIALIYRVGQGTKASNTYAEALYPGEKGNELKITIAQNVDDEAKFDVITLNNLREVDSQTVSSAEELKDNAWVTFKKEAVLADVAGSALTGGADGEALGEDYQKALASFEPYYFNSLGCPVDDPTTKRLFAEWTKRAVREVGIYHQLVGHNMDESDEYIIDVINEVKGEGAAKSSLVYYVAGVEAGCSVNQDLSGHVYRGEYEIDADGYDSTRLKQLKKQGKLVFHKVGNNFAIMEDLNTFTDFRQGKGEDFKWNQCIRVLNQRANDVQIKFNNYYLGKAGTSPDDRSLFKNDIVQDMQQGLVRSGAVFDYSPDDTIVNAGSQPRSYEVEERIKPNYAVLFLYHHIIVAREYTA